MTFKESLSSAMLVVGLALPAAADTKADDPAFVRDAAYRIDSYVAGWYRKQGLEVPAVTDDPTFLRRAFLVAIGRIPTVEEARSFLEIDDADKREQLIDYLIDSPGFASHMKNWAFDQLRVADSKPGAGGNFAPYRDWVRRAIENNKPWDEMTVELLSAEGSAWDPDSAAVGYYTRDRGMPLDNMANTMRIFLGSRIECAQCHDDPFGDTERREFYELAGFTHGQGEGDKHLMRGLWNDLREGDRQRRNSVEYQVGQILWDKIYGMSLSGGGAGRIKLPSDYQYRDGDPGEWIAARTPFGDSERGSDRRNDGEARMEFAKWVTEGTDERFASVIANRMWERVMGRGVYEPVDEYRPSDETHLPALMMYLVSLMETLEYDLEGFQKVLLRTKTFQFVPNPNPSKVPDGDDFHGRQLERLSAEQIWDSLITLSGGDPDAKPSRTLDNRVYVGNRPVLVGRKTMADISEEVLALESEKEVREYYNELLALVKAEKGGKGKRASGGDSMMMMSSQPRSYGGNAQVRASELPSPAPRDHLLFLFGQADREVIGSASKEPNVGQVLSLMNGFVQDQLVNNPNAHLYQSVNEAKDYPEKIRRIYIAILNRPPSEEEMGWMMDAVNYSGESALRNIVSALVMSSEFLFLQ